MAVEHVSKQEIVEVFYRTPEGDVKEHPALVLSTERLFEEEEGMFYAVLISTKNHHPEYTMKIEDEWLNRPLGKESYFVTHIVTFFKLEDVIRRTNTYVKEHFFYKVLERVIDSMFDIQVAIDDDDE